MLVKLFKIGIAFLYILFSTGANASGTNHQTNFLVLTDIHFDPFIACYKENPQPCPLIKRLQAASANQWPAIFAAADSKPSTYRQDTNYPLLIATLKAAKQTAATQQVQFVLILGDMLGHDYRRYYKRYAQDRTRSGYQAFVKKTLAFLSNEVEQTFPTLNVYSLVGNNDSYRHDYYSNPRGQFFQDTGLVWSELVKDRHNRALMQQEFSTGGYYAVELAGQINMRLIMLNSVLFSNKAKGDNINQAANQELDWLHKQLTIAQEKQQKVLIGMHIPEAIDVYSSLHEPLFRVIDFWYPEFTQRFQTELQQFSSEISGIFVGHLHADWFQVQRFDNFHEIPILGTPSISPIFGNNPGYKVYSYSNETGRINNFLTYYYALNKQGLLSGGLTLHRLLI